MSAAADRAERDHAVHRVRLVVTGRVQGVGFRWFIRNEATSLGLSGTVRNRDDGAVEIDAEGDRGALDRLAAAAARGPRGARVSRVDAEWGEGRPRFAAFTIAAGERS